MQPNDVTIGYYEIKPGEENSVIDLVLRVFSEFVAPLYSQEGITEFKKTARADALRDRLRSGNIVLLAKSGQSIIGVLEIRGNSHISLLFVDKYYQCQGIAKELLQRSIEICKIRKSQDLHIITVNSSPNAIGAYKKIGFKAIGDETITNGIRFFPLELTV